MTNSIPKIIFFLSATSLLSSCLDQESEFDRQQKQFEKEQVAIDNYLAENDLDHEIIPYWDLRYILSGTGNDTLVQDDDYIDVSYSGYVLGSTTPFKTKDTIVNLAQQIIGWRILLPKSEANQSITMFIPSAYGYGPYGSTVDNIPANATLMYELTVNKAYDGFKYQLEIIDEYLEQNEFDYAIDSTQSLRYVIVKQGTGVKPNRNSSVRVNYSGRLLGESKEFDARDNQTFSLPNLGVSGWAVLMPYIKEGGTIRMLIPARFGYGINGAGSAIPPNAILDFEVDLIEVL